MAISLGLKIPLYRIRKQLKYEWGFTDEQIELAFRRLHQNAPTEHYDQEETDISLDCLLYDLFDLVIKGG